MTGEYVMDTSHLQTWLGLRYPEVIQYTIEGRFSGHVPGQQSGSCVVGRGRSNALGASARKLKNRFFAVVGVTEL